VTGINEGRTAGGLEGASAAVSAKDVWDMQHVVQQ